MYAKFFIIIAIILLLSGCTSVGKKSDPIIGTACNPDNDCPEGYICYPDGNKGYKMYDCNKVDCVCYKYCYSDDDCPAESPKCGARQVIKYQGWCE